MLDFIFAMLGIGAYSLHDVVTTSTRNAEAEGSAIKNNRPYYIDNKGKFRVVGTGRLCSWGLEGGNRVLREHGTGRIVYDTFFEHIKKVNDSLREQKKAYHIFPVQGKGFGVQVENETQTPFKYKSWFDSSGFHSYIKYAKGDEYLNNHFEGEIRSLTREEDELYRPLYRLKA